MRDDAYNDDRNLRGDDPSRLSGSGRSSDRDVTPRLVHLDDLDDFQVADGDPDIRGWDVRTADGEKIGKVKDLVVDTGLMKVRYIEATIDKDVLNASDDRHVLIPIGSARLDDDEDDVFLSSAIVDPRTLPPYDRNALSREYEMALRDRFPSATSYGDERPTRGTERASTFSDQETPMPASMGDRRRDEDDFYGSDLYDEARFFGQRRRGREDANYIGPIDDETRRRNENL
jgi:hypothetical protein